MFESDLYTAFKDSAKAERNITTLHEWILRTAPDLDHENASSLILNTIVSSADPDMALTNLLRFLEASFTPSSLLHDLAEHEILRNVIVLIFSSSQYFSDIIVRDPELFRWLTASDVLKLEKTVDDYSEEVVHVIAPFRSFQKKIDSLKRFYRREILRIGTRDILGEADMSTATRELSALADVLIESTTKICFDNLGQKLGVVPSVPWTIIGLGKLGGRELNYSSDVDVVFVYREDKELTMADGGVIQAHEFFNRLTDNLVQAMTIPTGEGALYRIDLRLRPEGYSGPLAQSMQRCLAYYEYRGELWERQMLIKARPVAGDQEFGMEFLKSLSSFIYPRTHFKDPFEEIGKMKTRIEARLDDDKNIKLGAGGIRDIEFIVQALQLLHGGKVQSVRQENTLVALDKLLASSLLSEMEWKHLNEAYIFFRNVEHRLQIMHAVQTHSLPSEADEIEKLAKRLGLPSADVFNNQLEEHRREVRNIFSKIFIDGEHSSIEIGITENMESMIQSSLFRHVDDAKKNLQVMMVGTGLGGSKGFDARTQEEFQTVAPEVLNEIRHSVNPDLALANLARIISGSRFPDQVYKLLGQQAFRHLIVLMCGTSGRIVDLFLRYPLFFEILTGRTEEFLSSEAMPEIASFPLHLQKHFYELRAILRNIVGKSSLIQFHAELSSIADKVIRECFKKLLLREHAQKFSFALFGFGKLGGEELTIDSDLDIIFLGQRRPNDDSEDRMAQELVRMLTEITDEGRLYEVDTRLRPEGRNAPLVSSLDGYRQYLSNRASLWEIQSLTKARPIIGDEKIMSSGEAIVNTILHSRPLTINDITTIIEMRRKTETRSRTHKRDFFDIKLGAGGMMDIEFLVQTYRMCRISRGEAEPTRSTLTLLESARDSKWLSSNDSKFFMSTYLYYREIEKYLRLSLQTNSHVLPESGEKCDILARYIGKGNSETLLSDISLVMQKVRREFLQKMEDLKQRISS